jgi:hypothetical protein
MYFILFLDFRTKYVIRVAARYKIRNEQCSRWEFWLRKEADSLP